MEGITIYIKEKGFGLPKRKTLFVTMLLVSLIIINSSQALTVSLIENTDICKYDKNLNKDFCYSTYKICDSSFDKNKIDFTFRENVKDEPKKSLLSIETNTKISKESEYIGADECKIINITAYKNPFKNVDNIPCYDSVCFPKYAWWNSSFHVKYPINSSTGTVNLTNHLTYINDSYGFDLGDGYTQYVACIMNVTVNRSIDGYLYAMDNETYFCIDPTETYQLPTIVTEGNGSNYGNPDNVVMLIPMNGTDVHDFSGNNADTTNNGGTIINKGKIGKGIVFNGTDDDINVTDGNWNPLNGNFSISFWAKTTDEDNPKGFLTKGDIGGSYSNLYMAADNGNNAIFWGSNNWDVQASCGAGSWSAGEWIHMLGTYDGTTARLYIDAAECGTDTGTFSDSNDDDWHIGRRKYDTGDKWCDGCYMDEFTIWNKTLSVNEIIAIYNNTHPDNFAPLGEPFFNVTPPTPTPTTNITLETEKQFCYNDDYLYIKEPFVLGNGTIEFKEYLHYCQYGCSNWTLKGFGHAGCNESETEYALIFIFVVVAIALFIRWIDKK